MILGETARAKLGTKSQKVGDQGSPVLFLGGGRRGGVVPAAYLC